MTWLVSTAANAQPLNFDQDRYQYRLADGSITAIPFDTLTSGSQLYRPTYQQFPCWSELGNLGFPGLPLKWNGLYTSQEPYFIKHFNAYKQANDQLVHYLTRTPYALLGYTSGGTKDINGQLIKVELVRAISPGIHFTGRLDFINSPGHYTNQNGSQSTASANVSVDKQGYKLITGIERMTASLGENGGVLQENDVIGFSASPGSASVALSKGASETSMTTLKGRQEFILFKEITQDSIMPGIELPDSALQLTDSLMTKVDSLGESDIYREPRQARILHRFSYQLGSRSYLDKQTYQGSYYDHYYIDSTEALDSAKYNSFYNSIGVSYNGFMLDSIDVRAQMGLAHNLVFWRSNALHDWFQQLGLEGQLQAAKNRWQVDASLRFNILGYAPGNYDVSLQGKQKSVNERWEYGVEIESQLQKPGIFLQHFSGNHDYWDQELGNQQSHGLKTTFHHLPWNIQFDLNTHLISNWVYFNNEAIPQQSDHSSVLVSSSVRKNFIAGPFRSNNFVHLQYTPASEIPLPLAVMSSSTFMHHDVNFRNTGGKLEIEYGLDVRYCTGYDGYAYKPSTGAFYLQNQKRLGNYPYIDVFAMLRVKRTRAFIRYEHVTSDLIGGNYFPVLNYPVKKRFLKYGFYWHFND